MHNQREPFRAALGRFRGPSGQAVINILSTTLNSGISFLVLPVITRMLNPASFGAVSIYSAWMAIVTLIIGLQTSGTLGTARVHFGEENYAAYRTSAALVSLCALGIIGVGVACFLNPISAALKMDRTVVLLMLAHSFGVYCVSFVTDNNIYSKQALKNLALSLLVVGLSVSLSIVLINRIQDPDKKYLGRILGTAIPNILLGIPLFAYCALCGRRRVRADYFRYCLTLCLPLVPNALSQVVLSQSDRVMMQWMSVDAGTIGVYSLMYTFCSVLTIITLALNNAYVPFFFDDAASGDLPAMQRKTKNYVRLVTGICAGFLLLSPEVVRWYAGKAFWSGVSLIPVLAMANYMIFLYRFPVNYEFFNKKTGLIAGGTLFAALLNIGLNALLIPRYAALGAAAATAVSYMALFVFHEINARRLKAPFAYPYAITVYLSGLACMVAACAAFYLLQAHWYIRWPAAAAIGAYLLLRIKKQRSVF